VGSSTGRFDVGTERLVTPPIHGRADEPSVIGASVTAVAQGRGVCWSSRGARLDDATAQIADGMAHLAGGRLSAELPASVRLERSRRCRPELACR